MKNTIKKILIACIILYSLWLVFYLWLLPNMVSNQAVLNLVSKTMKKTLGADFVVTNSVLKTSLKPEIIFSVDNLSLKKDGQLLLNLQNIDSKMNFKKIFSRKLVLEKLGADDIYIDVNGLQNLKVEKTQKKKQPQKPFFSLDCFNTLFYIKNATVLYINEKGVKMRALARNLEISDKREPKMLHFGVFLDFNYNDEHLRIFFKDQNNVYFKDKKLHINDLKFKIEKSEMVMNLLLENKNNYNLTFNSNNFEIDNVRRFLNTDLIIPNGHEYVSCFKDFSGDFQFDIKLTNDGLNGVLTVNKIKSKLIPLADIPLTVTQGVITLNSNDIVLKDFKGYYGKNQKNKIFMNGLIADYSKTAVTDIFVEGDVYNEFAKYLSKIANVNIEVINKATTEFLVNFSNNTKLNIKSKVKVPSGSDILFEKASISPTKYIREFDIDMDLEKEILSINNIDYHILNDKNSRTTKPFVTVKGKMNVLTGVINELGFDIPEPLPSEFFNVLIGQKLFRNGTFSGKMYYINGKNPHIDGAIALKDAFIVGQGIFIKNLNMKTDNSVIKLTSDGIIRRARYSFDADILNRVLFPIIVKNTNLNFDEIDVEKVMKTFAPRPQNQIRQQNTLNRPRIEIAKSNISKEIFDIEPQQKEEKENTQDVQVVFSPNIIEIKKGNLNVKKGAYKQMKFGNLYANLSLTRQGVLEIKSNQFDFADGISTLKVDCDLAEEKYYVRLGAKDVDTDAIATSVLNLKKEISGHASALLEFNTDKSMKLNGKIQFEINDGSIAKLGLVQYVLNVASVFRNPLVMITPSSFADIVDIPDGSFKKINGTLVIKDNSVEKMMIKSSSAQLSSFIVGRLNLENMDASLRIYTKFSNDENGFFGFLRGISLNSLARKASNYIKGEDVSYYSAELSLLPKLEEGEETAQVFLTKFDGDIQSANFISSLQKIK